MFLRGAPSESRSFGLVKIMERGYLISQGLV